jgi:RecB family exonuclease
MGGQIRALNRCPFGFSADAIAADLKKESGPQEDGAARARCAETPRVWSATHRGFSSASNSTLALTDDQLDQIMRCAPPLHPRMRRVFVEHAVYALRGKVISDG